MQHGEDNTAPIAANCSDLAHVVNHLKQQVRQLEVEVAQHRLQHQVHLESEEVLDFWIGSRDTLATNFKRWFTPAGSKQQALVDAEIARRFGALLRRAEIGELPEAWLDTPRRTISLIIILDQFSRHVYRGSRPEAQQQACSASSDASTAVARCSAKALMLAQKLFANKWEDSLDTLLLVFALMPYRHAPNVANLEFVLERIADRCTKLGLKRVNDSFRQGLDANLGKTNLVGVLIKFESATRKRLGLQAPTKTRVGFDAAESSAKESTAAAESTTATINMRFAHVLQQTCVARDQSKAQLHAVFQECAKFVSACETIPTRSDVEQRQQHCAQHTTQSLGGGGAARSDRRSIVISLSGTLESKHTLAANLFT